MPRILDFVSLRSRPMSLKDKAKYEEELVDLQRDLEEKKASGADEYMIKKACELIDESRMMPLQIARICATMRNTSLPKSSSLEGLDLTPRHPHSVRDWLLLKTIHLHPTHHLYNCFCLGLIHYKELCLIAVQEIKLCFTP
ncbi:hypothetical protein ECG_03557 [Echinococcus granulosus]|uniref:Tubulin-specific chaperone A n=1 Tax=Echinococcus granulosus TaxID=6210 RepID=A0A068WUI1_ECHGR|nr:hypothetical protein ECG_03557 [Echinococcus granulosus]CDS23490.1 Tubulin binding cofactor A [Echinococcus granulosus]